jgi:hypothetical protein
MKYAFLLLTLSGCGIHVSSDPVRVEHYLTINLEAVAQYCQATCDGDLACYNECFDRIIKLLSAPQ